MAGAQLLAGLTLLGGWLPLGRSWPGAGLLLLLGGFLTLWLGVVWDDRQRRRSRGASSPPPGSPVAGEVLTILSDLRLPAAIEQLLRAITTLDDKGWERVIAGGGNTGLLDRPISSPMLRIDEYSAACMRAGHDPDTIRGTRACARDRQVVQEAEILLHRTAEAFEQFERSRCAVDRLARSQLLPFYPPYAEYRLTLAAVHALVAAEFLPENCNGTLSLFASVLASDIVDNLCEQ